MRDDSGTTGRRLGQDTTASLGNHPCLILRSSYGGERSFPLSKNRTVMGRGTGCDLRVALPMVDDCHCELLFAGGELRLRDLSREDGNGTLHNGQRIKESRLAHDDTLTLGSITFTVCISNGQLRQV